MALDPVLPSGNNIPISTAQWRRLDIGSTMVHDAHPLAARAGVISGFNTWSAGNNVYVGEGVAIVTPNNNSNGSYRVANNANTSVQVPGRHSSYTRKDLVVIRVYDADTDGSGRRDAVIEYVQGDPTPFQNPPNLPVGTLPIANVTVPPSGSISVSDARVWTCAAGGTIRCTSTSRPATNYLQAGQRIYEEDTGIVKIYHRGGWRDDVVVPAFPQLPRIASGKYLMSGGGTQTAFIRFPANRFTAPPNVVATVHSSAGAHTWDPPRVYGIGTTGFTLLTKNGDGCEYCWIAHQE